MSYPNTYNQGPPPGYAQPPQYDHTYGQQQYGVQGGGDGPPHRHWFGHHAAGGVTTQDRAATKRRKWNCMHQTLRHFALIVPFVIIVLNINIYATRRGRYERSLMTAEDPVFYDLWFTIPLSAIVLLWSIANVISMRRAPYRGGIPLHVQFGVELTLSLGTAVCWVLLVIQIVSKQSNGYYDYPYIQYEGALAFLLGLLMIVEFGLCAGAWSEFSSDRKRMEEGVAVI